MLNKVRIAIIISTIALAIGFSLTQMPVQTANAGGPDPSAVYKEKCVVCHGTDGSGNTFQGKKLKVKDLRTAEVQKKSDAQLYELIAHGKDKMPAYEATIGKEKVQLMVSYMRDLAKK